MSETKSPGEKKLSVSGGKLTLKPRTEAGVVRQSFSHGRSKQVLVEKVKRRSVGPAPEIKAEVAAEAPKKPVAKKAAVAAPAATPAAEARSRPASCCARSPRRRSPPARMRSPIPARVKPRSAR